MVLLGLLLAFSVGFFCILFLNKQNALAWQEFIGLAFPTGIAQMVTGMLILDWIGISLTTLSVSLVAVFLIVLWILLYRASHRNFYRFDFLSRPRLHWLNFVWVIFFVAIVCLAHMNFRNTLFYPFLYPNEVDSINGYETIGYITAQEHTLRNLSLFEPGDNPLARKATSYIGYAPLTQLSFTYIYLFQAETAKSIPALMFVSFLLVFYGLVKRQSGNLGAIIATFFMIITPVLLEISSLSMTNAPHVIYASLGVLYGILWLRQNFREEQSQTYLWISVLCLSASVLTRSDGVVFPAIVGLLAFYKTCRKQIPFKYFLYWTFSILGILVFWALFRKTGDMETEKFFITRFFIDIPRAKEIINKSFTLLFRRSLFGFTFYIFLLAWATEICFAFKQKTILAAFFIPIISLCLYFVLLYHMDYSVWAPLEAILRASAMRFYISLVPMAWFAVFSSYGMKYLLEKAEKGLSFCKSYCLLPLFLMSFLISCRSNDTVQEAKQDCHYTANDLKIGDYFYSDGTWSDGGLRVIHTDGSYGLDSLKPMPLKEKTVIGVVFQVDTGQGNHGLVMAVKKAYEGKAHEWINPYESDQDSIVWFLPDDRQWYALLQTLGGVDIPKEHFEEEYRKTGRFFGRGQEGICDRLNTWMQNIDTCDKHPFNIPFDLYWTTSSSKSGIGYVAMINDYGYIYIEPTFNSLRHYVRCVLAF